MCMLLDLCNCFCFRTRSLVSHESAQPATVVVALAKVCAAVKCFHYGNCSSAIMKIMLISILLAGGALHIPTNHCGSGLISKVWNKQRFVRSLSRSFLLSTLLSPPPPQPPPSPTPPLKLVQAANWCITLATRFYFRNP